MVIVYKVFIVSQRDAYLNEFIVGQAWQTDSLKSFMMQPASIYKAS